MSIIYNSNKVNLNIIDANYSKIKINSFFINNKFVIYINNKNISNLKNFFLKKDFLSMYLKTSFIKALFNRMQFSFLRGNKIFCVFTNDLISFLDIMETIKDIEFYYSYKKSICNITNGTAVYEEYNKYNMNYIYVQFSLIKTKIKIIIFLFLFLLTLTKYIK